MNNWTHNGKVIESIDDLKSIEPKIWGFVYMLTLCDSKGNVKYLYIGKKNIYSRRKRNFGKREIVDPVKDESK